MADWYVGPSRLSGEVTPPPSKSLLHRVLVLAALARGSAQGLEAAAGIPSGISEDIDTTLDCLKKLLAPEPSVRLDCGESGSTLRFLIPVAAALGKTVTFTGRGRLPQRPLNEYRAILQGQGVSLEFHTRQSLPLTVSGQMRGGIFQVPGDVSSQYITGLLLSLPLLGQDSEIRLTTALESAPYVDLTLQAMGQFGLSVQTMPDTQGNPVGWRVPGGQRCAMPREGIAVEADYSQAAFWLAAQYMGQDIAVSGLAQNSLQGDRAMIPLLKRLQEKPAARELLIDASQCPDLVPILAVAAAYTPGRTVIGNAARLALKESNRLTATAGVLRDIGVAALATRDAVIVDGGQGVSGGVSHAHGDHRIAMALAVAALGSQKGVTISGADAVAKSYPRFFEELIRLGGDAHAVNVG